MEEKKKRVIRCAVMSRVVGYYTDVAFWNTGKKREWEDRVEYSSRKALDSGG